MGRSSSSVTPSGRICCIHRQEFRGLRDWKNDIAENGIAALGYVQRLSQGEIVSVRKKSPSPGCGGAANVSPYGAVDAAANDHGDKERKDTEPAVAVEAVAADAVVAESSRREWFLGIH